jgi:hypothetical protein
MAVTYDGRTRVFGFPDCEPALHPDERGGGVKSHAGRSGYEPALHPDERGGGGMCHAGPTSGVGSGERSAVIFSSINF